MPIGYDKNGEHFHYTESWTGPWTEYDRKAMKKRLKKYKIIRATRIVAVTFLAIYAIWSVIKEK